MDEKNLRVYFCKPLINAERIAITIINAFYRSNSIYDFFCFKTLARSPATICSLEIRKTMQRSCCAYTFYKCYNYITLGWIWNINLGHICLSRNYIKCEIWYRRKIIFFALKLNFNMLLFIAVVCIRTLVGLHIIHSM